MRFNVIDIETTGFSYLTEKIIEVAVSKFENKKEVDKISFLVNPQQEIKESALLVNKINPKDLLDKPLIQEVISDVASFCGSDPSIGHNFRSFDIKFLDEVTKIHNTQAPKGKVYCSLALSRLALEDYKVINRKLETLLRYYKIPFDPSKSHRASFDCLNNGLLVVKMMEELGANSFSQLEHSLKFSYFVQPKNQMSLF
jgi:DNA polymerase III epsilon subunit family exonuclease